MGKLLTAILGIAALAGAAHFALKPAAPQGPGTEAEPELASDSAPSQPARQLDNVRNAARRLEGEQQQRLEGMLDTSK